MPRKDCIEEDCRIQMLKGKKQKKENSIEKCKESLKKENEKKKKEKN